MDQVHLFTLFLLQKNVIFRAFFVAIIDRAMAWNFYTSMNLVVFQLFLYSVA
jgi:hypothetical protein